MRNFAGIRRLTLTMVLAAPVFACGTGVGESEDPALNPEDAIATASAPQVSAEAQLDLEEIVKTGRLMFRQDREKLIARQATYEVEAIDGIVSITAAHAIEDAHEWKTLLSAPLVLETVGIARDQPFELGTGATGVGEGGRVVIDRNVAEEQFVNRTDGTEQRWVFEHKPLGSGDLVVRVQVSGLAFAGQSDRGHHFIDEQTGVGLVYGLATWIDLAEHPSGLDVRYDGASSELVITVPEALVESSGYPAVIDPVVSAEFQSTTPATGPSAFAETTPDVAFDGTNYLAVWADPRDAVSSDIWGTFITQAQTLVNPTGQVIFGAPGEQRNPAIAFNGTEYLVVFEDLRRGANLVDIFAIRIDTAGAQIGGEIAIANVSGNTGNPAVSALGANFLVAWEDRAGADSVVNVRGVIGGGVGGAFGLPSFQARRPAISCNAPSANCLVVFANGAVGNEDIHAIHVDVNGTQAPATFSLSGMGMGRQLLPDVAADGNRYMAVWQDARNGAFDIFGARVSSTVAATLDNTGFVISNAVNQQQAPTIAFDGTQYLAAWDDDRNAGTGRDIYGARVQTTRVVTDPAGIAIVPQTQVQDLPALTFGGGQFFVVWQDLRGGPPLNIRGTRITTGGVVPDRSGTTLANAANRQIAARTVFVGNGLYFVVWTDSRISGGNDYDIIAMRVRFDGFVLDPSAGRAISVAAGVQAAPDLSFDGTNILIVWQDFRSGTTFDIYGARVDATTFALLDPVGIPISTAAFDQNTPTVQWNAGAATYLVTWSDRRDNATFNIWSARVTSGGVVTDPAGRLINSQPGDQVRPDIATNGIGWFITWTDRRFGPNTDDIRGALLNGAAVVTTNDVTVSQTTNVQDSSRVAFNGAEYFVVFRDTRTSLQQSNIFFNRVTPGGAILHGSGSPLANSALQESRPDVALTGPGGVMFVVWSQSTAVGAPTEDLFGRQFSAAGVAVAPAFVISNLTGNEQQAAIGVINDTLTLVVYQRFDNTPNIVAERVRHRTVRFP